MQMKTSAQRGGVGKGLKGFVERTKPRWWEAKGPRRRAAKTSIFFAGAKGRVTFLAYLPWTNTFPRRAQRATKSPSFHALLDAWTTREQWATLDGRAPRRLGFFRACERTLSRDTACTYTATREPRRFGRLLAGVLVGWRDVPRRIYALPAAPSIGRCVVLPDMREVKPPCAPIGQGLAVARTDAHCAALPPRLH